ncbi:MAG: hypothetical protein K2X27_13305 [Candidatus Obscuribacterales bacterium]|nr:hypothetical protein [Candidatus Obscuribacterales bacterium]
MLQDLETPVHSAEKKIVLKAIADTPGQIKVADIATKTGLPILTANSLLNQIAYETGGHLSVGTAGSVVYQFDRNFQSAYLTRGSKDIFRRIWRIVFNACTYAARIFTLVMFFLLRISFGIILILSVVLVIVLIVAVVVAIMAKAMADDSNGPDLDLGDLLGGFLGIFRYWAFDWLWDWWYWGQYLRWDPYNRYREIPEISSKNSQTKQNKESFLDSCFSFLFGDGDPNPNLDERYWRTLGLAIKANNGTVCAEQLAPYAHVHGSNEDWVLPILVRFNGSCEVSENGNIIYSFPSFQQKFDGKNIPGIAAKPSDEDLQSMYQSFLKSKEQGIKHRVALNQLEAYLKENLWEFSHISDGSKTKIICLAVFISIASLWLSTLTVGIPFLLPLLPVLFAMASYGAMFLIIPGIRHLINQNRNKKIEERNSIRFTAANRLKNADQELKAKLNDAEQFRKQAAQQLSEEGLAYSTDKDYLEQEFENK